MDTKDVAQLVIRYELEDGYRYFLAKRTRDGYWEWIGGKRKKDEQIEETALRELDEEVNSIDPEEVKVIEVAEKYPSAVDSSYKLYPVLIELDKKTAEAVTEEDLSGEHSDFEWIDLTDFFSYETLGQYKALERLNLINGDVALGVTRNKGNYLLLKRAENTTSADKWTFPGGKVEAEENVREALEREVKEETGHSPEVIRKGEPVIGEGETGYWRLHPFLVEINSRKIELDWEHSDYRWIDLEEIHDIDYLGEAKSLSALDLEH